MSRECRRFVAQRNARRAASSTADRNIEGAGTLRKRQPALRSSPARRAAWHGCRIRPSSRAHTPREPADSVIRNRDRHAQRRDGIGLCSGHKSKTPCSSASSGSTRSGNVQSETGTHRRPPTSYRSLPSSIPRKRDQSKCGPGSVLRPAGTAMSEWPTHSVIGYSTSRAPASFASTIY